MLRRISFVVSGFILGLMLLNGCATTPTAPAKPMPAPKQAAAKAQQTASKKLTNAKAPAKKGTGPATRKVERRQTEIQDEFDFTLGDPLAPAVRKRIDDETYRAAK